MRRQREFLRTILEECARMKQLTDNLLNLARGELARSRSSASASTSRAWPRMSRDASASRPRTSHVTPGAPYHGSSAG